MTPSQQPASTMTLNGRAHPLNAPIPLPEFLSQLGLLGKPVVVELNQNPIPTSLHAEIILHPGDCMEIVTLAAGG